MADKAKKKILYFIKDAVATEAEQKAAAELGTSMFRNARGVSEVGGEALETCDGVAGSVPPSYEKKFKRVDKGPVTEPAKEPAKAATEPGKEPWKK